MIYTADMCMNKETLKSVNIHPHLKVLRDCQLLRQVWQNLPKNKK